MSLTIVEFNNGYIIIGENDHIFMDHILDYCNEEKTEIKRLKTLTKKKYKKLESDIINADGAVDLKLFLKED